MFDMFSASMRIAAQYRELFEAFTAMKFTEEQAMQLLIALMRTPHVEG